MNSAVPWTTDVVSVELNTIQPAVYVVVFCESEKAVRYPGISGFAAQQTGLTSVFGAIWPKQPITSQNS
jgi:hypothetical protein